MKQLAVAIPDNLRFLASLIARKPPNFSPDWASTVEQAFSLYTRSSTVNIILGYREILAEANWPFPAYLDLRKEVSESAINRSCRFVDMRELKLSDLRALWAGEPILGAVLLMGLTRGKDWRYKNISPAMLYLFWRHSKKIFQYWERSPLLAGKEPIIRDIRRTFRKGYWAACIPTVLTLLDYLLRQYFQTTKLNVSVQTLRNAFGEAGILPKDLKPGFALYKGLTEH